MTSTIHEAKTNLSKLIQKALAGEEVIIANRNKPVVKLVAVEEVKKPKRQIGSLPNIVVEFPDDFDEPIDYLFDAYTDDDSDQYQSLKVAEGETPYNKDKA